MSTINKTFLAYLKVILGAEYILGMIPKGTHTYEKFIEPKDLKLYM
jgi:2-polyprenyl-6-hydroxyphenyl methylase / 3-demethylubiquinone-9 3-methyltransferase